MATDEEKANRAAKLRRQAEKKVACQYDGAASIEDYDAKRLLHELQVHQAELEMQNEQLRHSQEELLAERIILNATLNATADGILAVSSDGVVMHYNQRFADLWDIPQTILDSGKDELMIRHVLEQLSDPDSFLKRIFTLYASAEKSLEDIFLNGGRMFERYSLPIIGKGSLKSGRVWSFRDVTHLRKAEESLKKSNDLLESRVAERTEALIKSLDQRKLVSIALLLAEEREREKIASKLHDLVGQSLLLAKMNMDELAAGLKSDSLHKYAAKALSLIETSISHIRALTVSIRPPILETAKIDTIMQWLCSSMKDDYGLQVEYTFAGVIEDVSKELRHSLYYAVRELLINVVKHAGTDNAQLSVRAENHLLLVQVVDNGAGFRQTEEKLTHFDSSGYGLYNVQQRIEHLGGSYAIKSAPGAGCTITLTVPLDGSRKRESSTHENNNSAC